ncbi:MAG: hypothetical protein GDA43_21565 [Hormoscilla sp. SP5CHS1]|nr:hypothetical protein [Hormoscilla sp. SP12CHS1]MBC6455458.1 hypothetical protein [Hormoscilla sp. SP5CHS1]MBC6473846.1 hypothetical protein [Hormoscilla sp. GM102CHS1]MBO1347698.1 hypothetical protein [Hormoscilla sp. GUM202]
MRPPEDENFSRSVHGCFGLLAQYLVIAAVLFFAVLFGVPYFFRTTFITLLFIWILLMFFVSLLFLLRLTEDRD